MKRGFLFMRVLLDGAGAHIPQHIVVANDLDQATVAAKDFGYCGFLPGRKDGGKWGYYWAVICELPVIFISEINQKKGAEDKTAQAFLFSVTHLGSGLMPRQDPKCIIVDDDLDQATDDNLVQVADEVMAVLQLGKTHTQAPSRNPITVTLFPSIIMA